MIDERIDRIIWKNAGIKSVRQIAEETGLTPEEILRRRNELKEEIDVLTIEEKQQKLLVGLEQLVEDLKDSLTNVSDERNLSGIANSIIGATKTINTFLKDSEKKNSSAVDSLNELRVMELVSLIQEVVDTSVVELAETYSLSEDELFSVFNKNLQDASQKRELQ